MAFTLLIYKILGAVVINNKCEVSKDIVRLERVHKCRDVGGYEGNGMTRMNGQNQNYNSLSQTLDYEASSSPMFLIQAPIAPLYRLERSLKK